MRSCALIVPRPERPTPGKNPLFQQAYAKHYWACKHAHEVSTAWEFLVKQHYAAATGEQVNLTYSLNDFLLAPPVTVNIPLSIGDCIRNLRSALDYLISAMARATDLSDSQTIFPFSDKRTSLEASFNGATPGLKSGKGRRAGALYEVGRNYPELKGVILDDIMPYSANDGANARGDLLWRIITADNIDKHRLMTPSVQLIDGGTINTTQNITFQDVKIQGALLHFDPGSNLRKDSDFAVDIVFAEPARLAGKPVTSTLLDGCKAVGEVIEIFGQQFRPPQSPIVR